MISRLKHRRYQNGAAIKEISDSRIQGTEFEEGRGITRLSIESDYAQVRVSRIPFESRVQERINVLALVADQDINIRFPKLTPSGMSFLVPESEATRVEAFLKACGDHYSVRRGRSIVSVHASGMREDDGLIARIVGEALESQVHIDLIADTHDRTMMVVETAQAHHLLHHFQSLVTGPRLHTQPHKRFPRKRIKVLKFGGTSVATPEARKTSARIVIATVERGFSPVVVVSAIGRKGLPYATDTLIGLLEEVDPTVPPAARELDLMLACGEIFSAVIFAHTLSAMGHAAKAFRGDQAGIITDGEFGGARIVAIHPGQVEKCLREGSIPVVCGFQGVAAGEVTTLGRGGSDTTASALGAALGAESVEIFTDVDGVMNADPRLVTEAETLRQTTYDEVAEMAHLGAKVIHPRAAEIAMVYKTPLWVKNTFSSDEGTEIVADSRCSGRRRTGVTLTGKLVYLQFDLSAAVDEDRAKVVGTLYQRLGKAGVNLFMVNVSPTSTGFAVPASSASAVEQLLGGYEAGRYRFRVCRSDRSFLEDSEVPLVVREACTMVSLVGRDYVRTPGMLLRALTVLRASAVSVLQTNDGKRSLSCLVPEEKGAEAARCLFSVHTECELPLNAKEFALPERT